MRTAISPVLAIAAVATTLAATFAVPASAAVNSASAATSCTEEGAVATLYNSQATVGKAAVKDDADGYVPVKPGEVLTLMIQGKLAEAVNGGEARVVVLQDDKPIADDKGDLKGIFGDVEGNPIEFPQPAGDFTWYLQAQIKEDASKGKYVQGLDAKNADGRQIMCFMQSFKVV